MKNAKKIISLTMAATMLAGTTTAFAIPTDAVVLGDQAYTLGALFDTNLSAEILDAITAAEGQLYYDLSTDSTDGFSSLFGQIAMTEEQKTALGEIMLTDSKDGVVTKATYETFNSTTPVDQSMMTAYNAALAAKVEADYTSASWTAYQVVVAANVVTVTNTQVEVDAATTAIVAAQANLVLNVVGAPNMKLTPAVDSINVNPGGTSIAVDITLELENFDPNVEATIEFDSTWGQISSVETTTDHKIVVKLYPEEDSEDKTAEISAKLVSAKNIVTGEILEDYVNTVQTVYTTVEFKVTDSGAEGKVYKIDTALTDQADRVFVNLNNAISDDAEAVLKDHPEYFKVFEDFNNTTNVEVDVLSVVKKDDNTLILVLDTNDTDFPLTDNVKHRVVVDGNNGDLFFSGSADFFLEDSSYIKLMRVESDQNDSQASNSKKLNKNQLRAVFSEAVNSATVGQTGYDNSVMNLKNWVINGLNLGTDLPSVNGLVNIEVESIQEGTIEREAVVITFNEPEDINEFLMGATHKLQVNTLGDWASVTDSVNIVATQELEYPGIVREEYVLDWFNDKSPEQFIVTFNNLAMDPAKNGFGDNFEIIVPDNTQTLPYVNSYDVLTEANDDFIVTELVPGMKYLIEMTQDWTQYYNTETTENNYHINRLNPLRLQSVGLVDTLSKALEDANKIGTGIFTAATDLTLDEDVTSPVTVKKEQITSIKGITEDGSAYGYTTDEATIGAGAVYIEMSEPVQFVDQNGVANVTPFNATDVDDNENVLTPSEQQQANNGVPVNTFEYVMQKDANGADVSQNVTVEGKIVTLTEGMTDAQEVNRDYAVVVEPTKELADGQWRLVIRSISDDVGNTMATEEMLLNITSDVVVVDTDLELVAVDAHHNVLLDNDATPVDYNGHNWLPNFGYASDVENQNDASDIIHVVFNKEMALTGESAVLNKSNYRLDGEPLPVDGTQIVRGIKGAFDTTLENAKTAITIILPDGYLQEKDNEHTITVINVAENDQTDGKEEFVNERVQVPYKIMHSATASTFADNTASTKTEATVAVEKKNVGGVDVTYIDVTSINVTDAVNFYIEGREAFVKVIAEDSRDFVATTASIKVYFTNATGTVLGYITVDGTQSGNQTSEITEVVAPAKKTATVNVEVKNVGIEVAYIDVTSIELTNAVTFYIEGREDKAKNIVDVNKDFTKSGAAVKVYFKDAAGTVLGNITVDGTKSGSQTLEITEA